MIKLFKPTSTSLLGIDICQKSVKIVELSRWKNQFCVERYAKATLPTKDGDPYLVDNRIIADCLRVLLAEHHFTSKKAVVAVPDAVVIRKITSVSAQLSEADLEEFVKMEINKSISQSIKTIYFDFQVLNTSSDTCDLLIVVVTADYVERLLNLLHLAGLKPAAIDVDSYAVERVMQSVSLFEDSYQKIVVIIDINDLNTRIFVLEEMKVVFVYEESFGQRWFIDAIAQRHGITCEKADLNIERDALGVLETFQELLLQQIRRILQFLFSSCPYRSFDFIFLTGAIATKINFIQFIEDEVNIKTEIINPFANMVFAKSINREIFMRQAPNLLVATGLAMRGIG